MAFSQSGCNSSIAPLMPFETSIFTGLLSAESINDAAVHTASRVQARFIMKPIVGQQKQYNDRQIHSEEAKHP